MHSDTNDAKLTAYALGELNADEAHAIEAKLTTDADARREVDTIRALAGQLTDELAKESLSEAVPVTGRIQRRWPARLALAAAASIVVGGVTAALVLPILEPARRSTSRQLVRPDGEYALQRGPAQTPPPVDAATNPGENSKIPYDDILRSPSNPSETAQMQEAIATQRGEIRHQFNSARRSADTALQNNDLATAQLQIERARGARAANPQLFTEDELLSFDAAISKGQSGVDAGQQQAVRTERLREQSATGRALTRSRELESAERERTVTSLHSNAAELERKGRKQEAEAVREQIAVLDPKVSAGASGAAPVAAPARAYDPADTRRNSFAANNGWKKSFGFVRDANDPTLLPLDEFRPDGAGPPARNVGPMNTEAYDRVIDNPFLDVVANPLSTFSVDVDTASYSNVRRFLTQGQLPPKDAVRIEEMINYFPYAYTAPAPESEHPFNADVEVTQCPWKPEHRLVRVALKGREIAKDQRPPSNLVFLIDVSGSMQPANKLPLLKESMKLLVHELKPTDRVSMVVYAGSSGLVLQSTPAAQKELILAAIDRLEAGGSTNGAQGIELAYSTAVSNFIKDGVNRVVLCTDGDFNVGVTNQGDLTRLIEDKAKTGVFLSVLGFGMGNVKDSTMEKLADKGNGNYAYVDTLSEGKKVLVDQMSSTLVTIAKDVKIQIEFNPAVAGAYRLIGYENRMLAKEDFNDDRKDAGEIGAGHTVTALYEIVPAGKPTSLPAVDALKYQSPAAKPTVSGAREAGHLDELMTLKLRYKAPDGDVSRLMEVPVTDAGKSFAQASGDLKFACGVAGFGMILRDSPHKGFATFGAVIEWAEEGLGRDEAGYRKEFIELVKKAGALSN